jgi:hypothetical protein
MQREVPLVSLSPLQTHDVGDGIVKAIPTRTVQTHRVKILVYALTGLYLCLLITEPSLTNCFRKFLGTLIFGVLVSLALLCIHATEEQFFDKFKALEVEEETMTTGSRCCVYVLTLLLSVLLTGPFDYAFIPSVRAKIDCGMSDATNGIKLTGVCLMIINMSVLLGRITIIKLTSLECLRHVSMRKCKLLKRVSRQRNEQDPADDQASLRLTLTFLQPKLAREADFYKKLIASHNMTVGASSKYIVFLIVLLAVQVIYCIITYLHEHVLGPNDVQQLMITFLLLCLLTLSLMMRLGYMHKIYENEEIVNEEAAMIETLTTEQVQMALATLITIISAIGGRVITFFRDSGIEYY